MEIMELTKWAFEILFGKRRQPRRGAGNSDLREEGDCLVGNRAAN